MKIKAVLSLLLLLLAIASPAKSQTKRTVVVPAGQIWGVPWSAEDGERIAGTFAVRGGEFVDMYIVTATNWRKPKAGEAATSVWFSGSVRKGQWDINMRAGDYYYVFDNRASPNKEKTVDVVDLIN